MTSDRSLLEREMQRLELRPFALEGFHRRRERKDRNRRIRAGALALVVAVVGAGVLVRAFSPGQPAVADAREPFLGVWISTSDADGGTQTMTVRASGDGGVAIAIVVTDDVATVCDGTPSTMTGTGRINDGTALVIPTPAYTCDDGSEPEVLSGPPLQEQLRDWTLVLDPRAETLSDGVGGVWVREGAEIPSPGPMASGQMWPQTSLEEVRQAQELADAGDPDYTWQVDPVLASDANLHPWDSEIVERFLREELGWEGFGVGRSGVFAGLSGGPYDEVVLIRCAPGRTNPLSNLYPNIPPAVRGCAPTIDDFRYETVRFTVEQPGRRGPSGVWVVTGWEMLQRAEPGTLYEHLYPQYELRQVEQVAPPSDAEVTALLEAFLGARVDGEGAERYVHRHLDGWDDEEVPVMYATTGGSAYERYEFDRRQGPVWPSGWIEFRVRLFAEDGTVVEQSFIVVRQEDGRLGLMYGVPVEANDFPTTEDGQPVALPYSILDGEVTFVAALPWDDTTLDRTLAILGGVGRGSAVQVTMFAVAADPGTTTGCEVGEPAADVDALVRSIGSNPDLEATAPVAASVGGIDALRMDVVAPGQLEVGECMMLFEGVPAGQDWPVRLYLLDLPKGMSARILAIAIVAAHSEFELVVRAAAPVLDSFEFHPR